MIKQIIILLFLTQVTLGYNPAIESFNRGQVSPLFEARSSFPGYSSGSRTIENMLVTDLGPVLKRPGTKYIATAKEGNPRVLPFEYSTDEAYIVEVGNFYARFYINGGQILDPVNPVEIWTPFSTSELRSIQYSQTDNEMYFADGTDVPQVLSRTSSTDWAIDDLAYSSGPYLPENERAITITPSDTTGSITLTASSGIFKSTPGASHVGSLWSIEQVRDSSILKGQLTPTSPVSLSSPFFSGTYSFITTNNNQATVTLQRSTNGGISWRAALEPLTASDFNNPAETEEDGAIYRVVLSNYVFPGFHPLYTFTITENTQKGSVRITGVASSTVATADVVSELVSTDATTQWREGYWSDFRGWPLAVAFHQQRLVFGGSKTYPQTLWFGKADPDEYTNFREGTNDTSAFTVAIPGQNPIRWMLSEDYLLIGTSGSCGKYGTQGAGITPTSPNYQQQTRHGSSAIRAILGGDSIVYVERGARNVREFGFQFQQDKYLSPNLNILSPEITNSGIVDVAFQLRPNPILWNVLANGYIASMTYNPDQSVTAWTKQITNGDFKSVATISGEAEDEVWISVNRGGPAAFIEQFQPNDWGNDQEDAWFVDSGLGYDSSPASTFTGLDHLNGHTVAVWADGIVQENEVVAGGSITLAVTASRVIVGLPFTAKLETLPIRADPSDYALNKKIKRLFIDFYKTGGVSFGNGANADLTEVNFTEGASVTAYEPLYTSEVKLKQFSWVYGGTMKQTVYLESSKPVPLGVRAIIPEMEIRR